MDDDKKCLVADLLSSAMAEKGLSVSQTHRALIGAGSRITEPTLRDWIRSRDPSRPPRGPRMSLYQAYTLCQVLGIEPISLLRAAHLQQESNRNKKQKTS